MFENKKIFFLSFISFSLLFAAPAFAQWAPAALGVFGLPSGSIYGIVANIFAWIMAVFFLLSLIAFVISGLMYLTAAGDDGQIEKAKKAMKYSLLGVITGLSGYVVVQAVSIMLNAGGSF